MKILALGDIVGNEGRDIVKARIPQLRKELELDFVIANGENSAGGIGITDSTLKDLLKAGIDCVTGGNHSWKHCDVYDSFDKETRILRPANYPAPAPGRGEYIYTLKDGRKIAILNIQGTTFMDSLPCPFLHALNWVERLDALANTSTNNAQTESKSVNIENMHQEIIDQNKAQLQKLQENSTSKVCENSSLSEESSVKIRIVDFHAEATSEKKAMGFALDGKVSAVFGTHTHVQTADHHILPEGTAYLTDLGMCGVELSCIGMHHESVLKRFIQKRPVTFKRAKGDASLNGLIMEIDDKTGLATRVSLLRENAPRTFRKTL